MLKHILISLFLMSSVALFAQLNFSGTTVGAPTANFPSLGATPASCVLSGFNEPYRVFTFKVSNTTTITVNFTNIIDGGGTDDTGFSWYSGIFSAANTCTNFIAVGDNFNNTNKTINVTANTSYSIAVIGFFGTQDAFAFTLTAAAGTVLPIELLSFTGKNTEDDKNILDWVTASEKDNKGFDIERSTDGSTFHFIGQVKGNNKPSSYQFVDNQPFTMSYYRLKQVDYDGTTTYSKVVSIEQKGKGKGLKVYPTLVSNGILIVDVLARNEATEGGYYDIYNSVGQQAMNGKMPTLGVGSLDVSALAKGTYVLKVGTQQAKFIKQ